MYEYTAVNKMPRCSWLEIYIVLCGTVLHSHVKHETGTDYEGNACLYYYYTFTNNGEENTSAAAASYVQCFQNGVQCEPAITTDYNDAINNYMMEVQPGGSIEVCEVYALTDTSDVTIEASDLISFSDEKDTQTITLQ